MSVGDQRTGGGSAAGACQLTIARAVSGPNPPPDPTPRFLRLLTIARAAIGQATWHAVVDSRTRAQSYPGRLRWPLVANRRARVTS